MPFARHFIALAVVVCAGLLAVAQTVDDAESLAFAKKKLDVAKKAYQTEADAFVKSIEASFDGREAAAREVANKKLVEQVKKERDAFKKWGDLPAKAERTKVVESRARLAEAYLEAARDYLRLKRDDAVEAVEKEHREFVVSSAILTGKKAYLSSLRHFNLKVENRWFANDGTAPTNEGVELKLRGGPVPHTILIVPVSRSVGEVSYNSMGKYVRLRAEVGVPKIEENAQDPQTPLVFEVLGDNKTLWRSKPVAKLDEFQSVDVKMEKVKILTLRVNCPEGNAWARAVWFEPMLIEP